VRARAAAPLRARAAALGGSGRGASLAIAGTAEPGMDDLRAVDLRRAARRAAQDCLVGIQGDRIVVVLGGEGDLSAAAAGLVPRFGPGAVVVGPAGQALEGAALSVQATLAGLSAAPAWPAAPRPVDADELLPERVLVGDPTARVTLVRAAYEPIAAATGSLLETLSAYLANGRSLEAAARGLYVHPNTVRYRLRKVVDLTGWDPLVAREAYVLQTAIALGALEAATAS